LNINLFDTNSVATSRAILSFSAALKIHRTSATGIETDDSVCVGIIAENFDVASILMETED
jgi:hypothetical protein